jgi:hypothetical protein
MENAYTRRAKARKIRQDAAEEAFLRSHPEQINNGEESTYRSSDNQLNYIANFTKGLPRNTDRPELGEVGEVDPKAYRMLLKALASGNPDDFEKIPLGGTRKFTNPQAGLAFDLEGPDCHAVTIPPAPRIDSAENSAEMGELYWMALLRDVHCKYFDSNDAYGDNDEIKQKVNLAAESMSNEFSDFRGPKDQNGKVTSATLFRGFAPGDLVGPYISQFLLKGNSDKALNLTEKDGYIRFGTQKIDQRQKTAVAGKDYMTDEDCWRKVQSGVDTSGQDEFEKKPLFIRNLRDLATYVHFDALYQAYLNACLYLLSEMKEKKMTGIVPLEMRGIGGKKFEFPVDRGNPYVDSVNQIGFSTFGGPHILSLVTEVATRALKAVWYQKWFVHRRLRPEEFGGRVHFHLKSDRKLYPMIDREILDSLQTGLLSKYFPNNGTYLLPMAFPEGSPTHPAYGAGHATVAGACVTILKAWFDESFPIENPLIASDDGTCLVDYNGADKGKLTVGGELNKLAANISIGRNAAGVHWRTDYAESLKLGEAVAIGLLQEQKTSYNENFNFSLTKFDGTTISI